MVVQKRQITTMKKYDFTGKFVDIDDTSNSSLARQLWMLLGTESREDSTVKLFGWYTGLKATGILQLDEADREFLYKLIDTSKRMGIVLKGQLLSVLKAT